MYLYIISFLLLQVKLFFPAKILKISLMIYVLVCLLFSLHPTFTRNALSDKSPRAIDLLQRDFKLIIFNKILFLYKHEYIYALCIYCTLYAYTVPYVIAARYSWTMALSTD